MLASDENGNLELRFLNNQSQRAGQFSMARADYLKAREAIRRMGKRVLDVCGREPRLWKIVKRRDQRVANQVPLKSQRRLRQDRRGNTAR